jgi:putative SOS response-associated peptidase YedK
LKKCGEPVDLQVFAFMTTTPNELVATINHERMPVVLTGNEQFETWLKGPPAEAFRLARQHPAEAMRIVQSGLEKEDLLAA